MNLIFTVASKTESIGHNGLPAFNFTLALQGRGEYVSIQIPCTSEEFELTEVGNEYDIVIE